MSCFFGFVVACGQWCGLFLAKVYAVIVDAWQKLSHHVQAGRKKGANVVLRAHPECGPNDGFLTVEVSTFNGCGISPGQPLAANFGTSFCPDRQLPCDLESSPMTKKLRTSLDDWFQAQAKKDDEAAQARALQLMPPLCFSP